MKKIFCLILTAVVAFYTVSPVTASEVYSATSGEEYSIVHEVYEEISLLPFNINAAPASAPVGDTFEEAMVNAIENRVEELDVSKFNVAISDLSVELKRIEYNNPLLFYWSVPSYRKVSGATTVYSVVFNYTYSEKEIKLGKKCIDAHTEKIISLMPEGLSDLGKALWLHEYVIGAFDYDDSEGSRDLYSMLKTKKGVCEAYVKVYSALLDAVGIANSYKLSLPENMNHVWSAVKIDGKWYNVDTTWDDGSGTYNLHKYFLLSDKAIGNTAAHFGADVDEYKCTDTKYDNYYVHEIDNSIGVSGEYLYYCDGEALNLLKNKINKIDGNGAASFQTFDDWSYFEEGYTWDNNCFTAAMTYENKLVYNSEKNIMSYDFGTGKTECIYTSELSIYGLYMGYSGERASLNYFEGTLGVKGDRSDLKVKTLYLQGVTGDADGNGTVDTADATAILKYLINEADVIESLSDCNHDGHIDTADATAILKYLINEYDLV